MLRMLKKKRSNGKGLTVVVDAGHGGHDGGAYGSRTNESKEVLAIAKAVETGLKAYGYNVIMTRSTDRFVTLKGRSDISNNAKADAFISLHLNSAQSSKATGFETFIYNAGKGREKFDLQHAVHDELMKVVPLRDRGKKRANFAVLRETYAPAVLIEYGFVNNPTDEKFIMENRNKLATATVNGINRFFNVESKQNESSKPSQSTEKPSVKEVSYLDKQLSKTLQKDAEKLFKKAYDEGVFHEDHSKKVKTMTRGEAYDLMFRYVARTK